MNISPTTPPTNTGSVHQPSTPARARPTKTSTGPRSEKGSVASQNGMSDDALTVEKSSAAWSSGSSRPADMFHQSARICPLTLTKPTTVSRAPIDVISRPRRPRTRDGAASIPTPIAMFA